MEKDAMKKKAKVELKSEIKEEVPEETLFEMFKAANQGQYQKLVEDTKIIEGVSEETELDVLLKEVQKGFEDLRIKTMKIIHDAMNKLRNEKDLEIKNIKSEMENQEQRLNEEVNALTSKLEEKNASIQELKDNLNSILAGLK